MEDKSRGKVTIRFELRRLNSAQFVLKSRTIRFAVCIGIESMMPVDN